MFYTIGKIPLSKGVCFMSGSVFGTIFRVSTWGESHGKAIGAVIDGCPAGLPLCEADIQPYLDRRKPGSGKYVTQRKEADEVQILSGIFDGKTTGTPISLLVYNTSQRSSDYTESPRTTAPDMQTTPLMKNTAFVTIAAAVVPLPVKPLCAWLPERLRCWRC